jgi:hypothetical protein
MNKREIAKYNPVAKNLSKKHSVGDGIWSAESFIEGFNQAVQFLEPNPDLVQCPKCNTTCVAMETIGYPQEALPILQYPSSIDAHFICHKCEHKFHKLLKLSAQ